MKKRNQKIGGQPGLSFWQKMVRDWQLWALAAIPITFFILFRYLPMFGVVISFQDYKMGDSFIGLDTKWVGLKHFIRFFKNPYCWRYIKNTLAISVLSILFTFPAGIFLALLFNEIRLKRLRSFASSVSILPHFISVVVIVAMLKNIFSVDGGLVNNVLNSFGIESIDFLGTSEWFRPLYIGSGMWSGAGYAAIVYTAAIAGIDPGLYEASKLDGANRWHRLLHITLPCLVPTIATMLILRIGNVMSVGYEKVLLMQTGATNDVADILSTYTYRIGILDGQSSYAAAIGLFNSVVNLILIIVANATSRKLTESSLW
jgi:putative aldouronate transport system permease protein